MIFLTRNINKQTSRHHHRKSVFEPEHIERMENLFELCKYNPLEIIFLLETANSSHLILHKNSKYLNNHA